ncbi:MAG: hypothetical protein V4671_15965 [Armatimonadota bacterium]
MNSLKCYSELLEPEGILRIAFAGFYPPGSKGNPTAEAMSNFVRQVVQDQKPLSVLLDLSDLEYRWGDAIFGIVVPFHTAGWMKPLRSVCVLAVGETAQALRPLFKPNMGFGIMGAELFEEEQKALAYLNPSPTMT